MPYNYSSDNNGDYRRKIILFVSSMHTMENHSRVNDLMKYQVGVMLTDRIIIEIYHMNQVISFPLNRTDMGQYNLS